MFPGAQPTAPQHVVAIVDGDMAVCSALKFALEVEGFLVQTYCTGDDLLASGDVDACDCYVVDQGLSGMSGMALIAELRKRRVDSPSVLITSDPSPTLRARACAAGIPVIEKPLLDNWLVEKIREACRAKAR